MSNYISVFYIADDISKGIKDLGEDPFFSEEFATWGICRPQVRTKWLNVGGQIIFIGYYKRTDDYYLKGYFKVGEKINQIEALKRYPTNKNVIVSKTKIREKNTSWKEKRKKEIVEQKYENEIPSFLKQIKYKGEIFQQSNSDEHEIDNWKCQRIFLCNYKQFSSCVEKGICEKEKLFPVQKGYLIASEWEDLGKFKIKWKDVCPKRFCQKKLKTPKGQHNVMKITNEEIIELMKNVKEEIENKNLTRDNS